MAASYLKNSFALGVNTTHFAPLKTDCFLKAVVTSITLENWGIGKDNGEVKAKLHTQFFRWVREEFVALIIGKIGGNLSGCVSIHLGAVGSCQHFEQINGISSDQQDFGVDELPFGCLHRSDFYSGTMF